MNNRDKNFLAYLAGLIDGEGYIGITKGYPKDYRHPCYKPTIGICMTDAISLLVINQIYPQFRFSLKGKTTNRRQVYRLEIQNTTDCHDILKLLKPYLFVKREQADILLSYTVFRRRYMYSINGYNSSKDSVLIRTKKRRAEKYFRKSEEAYQLLRQKKQEPINGMKTVKLLRDKIDLRQYRAKREDYERLLEGVETRVRKQ